MSTFAQIAAARDVIVDPGLATRIALAIARWTAAGSRAIAHRWEVRTLLELDDRALRDIGLARDDVRRALDQPLAKDPSTFLMIRAVDRRSRRRALAPSCRDEG